MFAGLGTLPPSIEDRSIVIRLLRKKKNQATAKFKERIYTAECKPFYEQLARWSLEAMDHLRNAVPESPKVLNDRAEDFWELPKTPSIATEGGIQTKRPVSASRV